MKYFLRAPTPEERAASEADHGWHEIHDFMRGWGLLRRVNGKREVIFRNELPDRLTFAEFKRLKQWRQDAIMVDLAAKKEERRKMWAAAAASGPPPVMDFSKLFAPTLAAKFPTVSINDIVSVQPMLKSLRDA